MIRFVVRERGFTACIALSDGNRIGEIQFVVNIGTNHTYINGTVLCQVACQCAAAADYEGVLGDAAVFVERDIGRDCSVVRRYEVFARIRTNAVLPCIETFKIEDLTADRRINLEPVARVGVVSPRLVSLRFIHSSVNGCVAHACQRFFGNGDRIVAETYRVIIKNLHRRDA